MAKTVNEKLMSKVVKHRQFAVGVEKQIQRKLWAEVQKVRKDVVAKLAEATASGTMTKKDLDLLITDIRVRLDKGKDQLSQSLAEQLPPVYTAEEKITHELLRTTLPVVLAKKLVLRRTPIREVGDALKLPVHGVTYEKAIANMFDRLDRRISQTAEKAFAEEFHKQLLSGAKFSQAKRAAVNVADSLGGKIGEVSQLFTKQVNRDLKTIVNGHVQRALDQAQTKVFQDNSHLLQGVVYTATLDRLTCEVCAALDGTMYWMGKVPEGEAGRTFAEKPQLPMHPNCRCCYAPIVKSWQNQPVKRLSKPDKQILNGDIPRPKKYADWFAEQNKSTQVDILGPAKYQLWKSGQVKLSDMATMDRALTVGELEAKAGVQATKAAESIKEATATLPQDEIGALYDKYMVKADNFDGLLAEVIDGASKKVSQMDVMGKVWKYENPDLLVKGKSLAASVAKDAKELGIDPERFMTLLRGDIKMSTQHVAGTYLDQLKEAEKAIEGKVPQLKKMADGKMSLEELSSLKDQIIDQRLLPGAEWTSFSSQVAQMEADLKMATKNLLTAEGSQEQRKVLQIAKDILEDKAKMYKSIEDQIVTHNNHVEYWLNIAKAETKKLVEIEAKKNKAAIEKALKKQAKKSSKASVKETTKAFESATASDLEIGELEYRNWINSLDHREVDAFKMWTRKAYTQIRNMQLGRLNKVPVHMREVYQEYIDTMKKAVARAKPFEGDVYRGALMDPQKAAKLSAGQSLTFESFNSGSWNDSVAKAFMENSYREHFRSGRKPVRFRIKNKTGVRIEDVSEYSREGEVLLRPGARYIITEIEEKPFNIGPPGKTYLEIWMREVLPE